MGVNTQMANLAFFGTPEFALESLRALHQFCTEHRHQICLVVTQPDQKQGRGQHFEAPPVKKYAEKFGFRIAQPISLKKSTIFGEEFFSLYRSLNIDLGIVVAYGKIIPERILKTPKFGMVNVHASLLPKYRGAAPIQRSIIEGEKKTGISLMDMVLGLDEGDVLAQEETIILSYDTAKTLSFRLAKLGADLLCNNLEKILNNNITKIPQENFSEKVSYAAMLSKKEGKINFSENGENINNKIMGFNPWPTSYCFINNLRVKFYDSFFIKKNYKTRELIPGRIAVIKPYFGIECIDGIIYVRNLQWEGKKLLPASQSALAHNLKVGDVISFS